MLGYHTVYLVLLYHMIWYNQMIYDKAWYDIMSNYGFHGFVSFTTILCEISQYDVMSKTISSKYITIWLSWWEQYVDFFILEEFARNYDIFLILRSCFDYNRRLKVKRFYKTLVLLLALKGLVILIKNTWIMLIKWRNQMAKLKRSPRTCLL